MISQKGELTTGTNKLLILGSGSGARKELLDSIGLSPHKIEIPDVDESLKPNESPRQYVSRVARLKATAISCDKQSYLITADTIVSVGKRVLAKTSNKIPINPKIIAIPPNINATGNPMKRKIARTKNI